MAIGTTAVRPVLTVFVATLVPRACCLRFCLLCPDMAERAMERCPRDGRMHYDPRPRLLNSRTSSERSNRPST